MSIIPISSTSSLRSQKGDHAEASCSTSNKSAAIANSVLFNEDAHPPGTFVTRFPCKVVAIDSASSSMDVEMRIEDVHHLSLELCKIHANDPALQLEIIKHYPLPEAQAIKIQYNANKKLADSADDHLLKEVQTLHTHKRPEKITDGDLGRLFDEVNSLKVNVNTLSIEMEQISKEWEQKVTAFYQKSIELFVSHDELQIEDFFLLFHRLRELNPGSLIPFYPFLTFFSSRLDGKTLESMMKKAKECDPFRTYALIVAFLKLSDTCKKNFLFKDYDRVTVLTILKKIYPDDLIAPLLLKAIQAGNTQTRCDLPKIAQALEVSLDALASRNEKAAINHLVRNTPALRGYSELHRYLSLAWLLQGSFEQAEKIFTRSTFLPKVLSQQIPEPLYQILMWTISKSTPEKLNIGKKVSVTKITHDPLKALIEMAKNQSFDIKLAKNFVDQSRQALEIGPQDLPIIYFGMRWLASRQILKIGAFETLYRPFYLSLFELMTSAVAICHTFEGVDPWISERFKMVTDGDYAQFIVTFPYLGFGSKQKELLPTFKFLKNLELAPESIQSLSNIVTKQTFSLVLSLLVSHCTDTIITENPDQPITDDPAIFLEILYAGLTSEIQKFGQKTPLFDSAIDYLDQYLNIPFNDRPYHVSSEILEWAKFSIFLNHSPFRLKNELEEEIRSTYYPDFPIESFKSNLNQLKKILNRLPSNVDIALRDATLAHNSLVERSTTRPKTTLHLDDADHVFSIFKTSQTLFGWCYGEPFNAWGERLKLLEKCGIAAFDHHLAKMEFDATLQSPEIEYRVISGKARELLRLFLQFWIKFQQETAQKNGFIADGGDEDSSTGTHWITNVDPKLWASMIQANTPQKYPGYNKLSKEAKKELNEWVSSKHTHAQEVIELKKHYLASKNIKDFEILWSAALIANTEYERSEAHHSIYIGNESSACRLYQLLLEIAVNRILGNALIQAGANHWTGERLNELKPLLSLKLDNLIGAFHGPEIHMTGKGPLQKHFNAAIAKSTSALVNTHIYFD